MKQRPALALALVLMLMLACGKQPQVKQPSQPRVSQSGQIAGQPSEEQSVATAKVDGENFIHILAGHTNPEKKAADPVVVNFPDYKVTTAAFDPSNLEGGKVSLTVKIATLNSGIRARDQHLNTADLLNSAKFAVARIEVSDVRKNGENGYAAKMKVDYRGIEKQWDIRFVVLAAAADKVKVRLKHPFQLDDFNIGDAGGNIANSVTLDAQLWIRKSN